MSISDEHEVLGAFDRLAQIARLAESRDNLVNQIVLLDDLATLANLNGNPLYIKVWMLLGNTAMELRLARDHCNYAIDALMTLPHLEDLSEG